MRKKLRMAVIFNSNYKSWPMGGMRSYINEIIAMLQDDFSIDLYGCEVDFEEPVNVSIRDYVYDIKTLAKAKTGKKIVPNLVKCFIGTFFNSKELNINNYDILYFHFSASLLAWKIRHLFNSNRKPFVIMHQHGMAYNNKVGNYLNYKAMNYSDLVLFTTEIESINEKHNQKVKTTITWMPSVVDTSYFVPGTNEVKRCLRKQKGYSEEANIFIYTGRITSWKNPILLAKAFKNYLERNHSNDLLLYVGEGDCFEGLKNTVRALKCEKNILMLGSKDRDEIRELLQISDIFVLPSQGEGLSVSALEAMSVDIPVIGFNVVGMKGLINDKCGILVQKQTEAALADALECVLRTKKRFEPRQQALNYDVNYVKEILIREINKNYYNKEKYE